jgi:hypothetical protein
MSATGRIDDGPGPTMEARLRSLEPDSSAPGDRLDRVGPYTCEFTPTSEGWRAPRMHLGVRWTQGTDAPGASVG